LASFEKVSSEPANAYTFLSATNNYFITSSNKIDAAQERVRLTKELEAAQNLLQSTQAKLNNEKFISNAKPDLVAREKQKLADAETRISSIEASLKQLV
jgi:valyl-tRNA synthetase